MARSLNQVMLIGNVGQDPEVRTTQNGAKTASFSLATSREWKNASGERQEKTEWHRCVVWNNGKKGGLADVVEKYVNKGDKLHLGGRIEYRQWEDKEGVTRHTTEIVVSDLMMLSGKSDSPRSSAMPGSADPDEFPSAPDDDDDLPF